MIYAISISKPGQTALVKSLNTEIGEIKRVEILGKGSIKFEQSAEGLKVSLPKGYVPENGFVIKVIT